ncbi:MAG TPA: NAD-dependent epimerase/dehydratase family protein [Actinomycetota bacterium]|nr:NAD-dependent epimerase/dehydratase family protein [Actinomycetota bacterium]
MPQHVVVTGGAGFIGSHIVDALRAADRPVVVLDRLSSGGSMLNLERHADDPGFTFVLGDVTDPAAVAVVLQGAGAVIHAAAESHVDRSIDAARGFVETNVLGTQTVLEAALAAGVRMLLLSTDEVYGAGDPAGGLFEEDSPLRPRSPYAASKAAADLLCQAYVTTYGADVTVVRGTNAYGPRQIERVIPTYAINALEGRPVPVYGEGRQRREFLHVRDWARAAITVLDHGAAGMVYNIGDGFELENRELARRIVALAGADPSLIVSVPDRPGHDFRYGVRADRVHGLGWRTEIAFDDGLAETVEWYAEYLPRLREAHVVDVVTAPRAAGAAS